ncbi:hypothetical protein [Ruegeria arenilitoris]|uniref:hypothetical protein n=1 Tax=Ruegeria arenilitoris TaxID=1173585 RepID=UPI00147F44D0|nr:hypothetical protein [Ruegeria arenilitoris]
MRILAGVVFTLGAILMIGAALMAFDTYMTDDRRTAARDALNAQLDEGAAEYEKSREDGCRRRCGGLGSLSHLIVNIRDGIFLSLPFDPSEVFPATQPGWTMTGFSIEALEPMLGQPKTNGRIGTTSEHDLWSDLNRVTKQAKSGAVRVYRQGDKTIALGIKIYREGLHAARDGEKFRLRKTTKPFAEIDGVLVRKHPQFSYSMVTRDYTPTDYQLLSIYMDGQVEITVVSDASNEELEAFFSAFDLTPIVENLPKAPSNYAPGKGVIIYESRAEGESDS